MKADNRPVRLESYEVYDHQGNPVGRVVLPRSQRFLGASRGTVYLDRQPTLRRAESRGNPQAA
jgi:hypothetical protein